MNKEALNKLMKEFLEDCVKIGEDRYQKKEPEPTFANFVRWLDDRTWDME